MTDTTLTDAERDSLTECECGHYLNEHSSDGCLAVDDLAPDDEYLCVCMASPDRIRERAIESIVAARVADRDALVRWKAEALQVLAAWDDVWKALGSPGLGEFKPASALGRHQRAGGHVTDTTLTDTELTTLDGGIREWEDNGGPLLNALKPAVERIVAARVADRDTWWRDRGQR